CLAFFFTSVVRAEWMWKGAVCAAVAVAMLAAKVPQFFANLYAYSFGSYFVDFLLRISAFESFRGTFVVTGRGGGDFRAFLIFIVSMATVAVVAFRGTGALRRFAIAVLVCEVAIITIGSVNALILGLPMRLDYAEVAHSPLWGAYFVLVCMSIAVVIDRRLATLPAFASGRAALSLRYVIKHRRTIYASALAAVLFVIAILLPPVQGIPYPPAQPPIVKLFEREVAVAPGAPFRGRVLITLGRTFNRLKIRPALGNDLSVDLLPFGIP